MKKFINKLLVAILILCGQWSMVNGQTTTAIPYQGVARNAAGNIVANQPISLRFSLLQGAPNGTLVYQETHNPSTNSLGLFDVKITGGTTTGVFNPIAWSTLAVSGAFLKVEMDINGGAAFVDMGTTQLLSVPFALYADKSGSVIQSLGSVVYAGTWNALTNDPPLTGSTGNKGDYYVVTVAGNHSLNGISDWDVNDWAIYNGSIWQKVDNSQAPVNAAEVAFSPNGDITSTNVQGAIVEVRDDADTKLSSKLNLSGGTMTGDLLLHAAPSTALCAATKKYVDDADLLKADKVIGAVVDDIAALDANGNLVDGGKKLSDYLDKGNTTSYTPSSNFNPATKKYVDDADASSQTQINTKVSKAGDTMTGFLVLSDDPATALGAATKQYVDAEDALKLNLAGGTMTGDLVLHAAPSTALGAATKKYVDDADQLKADKVAGASNGNFATLTATGNLVDGGEKTAGNIAFVPTTLISSTNVQDAITSVNGQFANLIDSYIHRTEDGVSIYLPPSGTRKRFGIGDTAPESPLGISSEGTEQRVLTMKPGTLSTGPSYTFSLRSSGIPGFSIDDVSTGVGTSRFFIKETDGYVGLGTSLPNEKLHIESSTTGGITGIKILNTATIANQGWSLGHINDASVVDRDGAFGFFENSTAGGKTERITILPGGRTGINETLPYATLHINRPVSDPQSDINLNLGSGIVMVGQSIGKNLVIDNHQLQAREYNPLISYSVGDATIFNIQPFGGGVVFNNSLSADKKVIIDGNGKIGVGKDPIESIDVNGAITFGNTNTVAPAEGTVRWHAAGTPSADLELYKSGAWKSLTTQTVVDGFAPVGPGMIAYNAIDGKVGINETLPDTKLHVSRPLADAGSEIALSAGTGIVTIGPMTNNIVADYRGIQARTGVYIGSTIDLSASELNIQRLGGNILFHGDNSIAISSKGIITNDGYLGLGTITPAERIDIAGAIKIGNSTGNNIGTIRWTGTDFEGRKSGAWVSLTAASVASPWTTTPAGSIYFEPAGLNAKVGIGISTPTSALQVYNNEALSASNSASAIIHSEATTSSTSFSDTRVGIEIKNSTQWSTNADARNVGIYISNVSGQSSKEANIAAVMNGNVVVGDLTSSKVVGSNGTNVLAIQSGSIPTSAPGTTTTTGIQIYSNDLSLDAVSPPASIFHLMNGDGTVIKLFRGDALSAPDNSTISSTTYGTTEESVINNLRTRINELETRLRALGLLN